MSRRFPLVPLSNVLRQYKEYISAPEPRVYPKLSVKLYGKGVVLDSPVDGTTLKMQKHQLAKAGQVILSEIWGKKGAIGFVPPEGDGALCTSHFFLFDIDRDQLLPQWLQAMFSANYLERQLDAEAKGTTGYAAVRPALLLKATIPLPPLHEQRRIVERIESIAGKVEEARGLRGAAEEEAAFVVAGLTTRIFDKLLRGYVAPIRSLGPEGSNPIQIGPFGAQLHSSEFTPSGVPVLNVGNVWPQGVRTDRVDHVTHDKATKLSRYAVQNGDLLFARSGATLGKVCLVPEQCNGWLMTGHLFRVRFDPSRIYNRFAFIGLRDARQVQDRLFGQVRGATRPGYNTTLLGNIEIPVPPMEVQQHIVEEVDAMQDELNRLTDEHSQTSKAIAALVPAVLDKAFRGEM